MAFLEPFVRMLGDIASPAQLRAIEGGAPDTDFWSGIEASGYLDTLVSEERGGAGLSLADAFPLFHALGTFAVGLPVGEMMALWALAGADVDVDAKRRIGAVIAAAAIAGAGDRLLAMTIDYASQRVQFGKPIARQQAVQQQLAVMAEQVVMARIAAQTGCAHGLIPSPEIAAIAKHVTSSAAIRIAAIAHAVHGAIGISEAHDLSRFTRHLRRLRMAHGSESYWAERLGRARLAAPTERMVDHIRAITG